MNNLSREVKRVANTFYKKLSKSCPIDRGQVKKVFQKSKKKQFRKLSGRFSSRNCDENLSRSKRKNLEVKWAEQLLKEFLVLRLFTKVGN